jgi:ribosomal silencing factor RsfS
MLNNYMNKRVDYIDVIVQIFDQESRGFYDFDRLLAEAEEIDISGFFDEEDK